MATRAEAQAIEVRDSLEEPYDLDDMDEEALGERGLLRPEADAIIRAGSIEGWSFAIQPPSRTSPRAFTCQPFRGGTRVIALCREVNPTQRVAYAVDS